MAIRFALGFAEDSVTIDGVSALHITCTAAEAATANNLYSFDVVLRSTNGRYSQSWAGVVLPEGKCRVDIPFVPPLEWANDFSENLGDTAHAEACGLFCASMTAHYTMLAGTLRFDNDYTGYAATVTGGLKAGLAPTVGALTVTQADTLVPAEWGVWVQGKSTLRIAAEQAAGVLGSRIVGYRFGTAGMAQAENSALLRLTGSGEVTLPVTVEDSRGRQATADLLIKVLPYAAPALAQTHSRRCAADGAAAEEGSCFLAQCRLTASAVEGHNVATVCCAWKKVTEESYGSPVTLQPDGDGVVEQVIDAGLEKGASYEVKYTVRDAFGAADYYDYISSTVYLLHFLKGGTGIAVGKAAEAPELFDVALPTRMRRDLAVGGELRVTGGLTLAGTDVSAALRQIGTVESGQAAVAACLTGVTENLLVRCGRMVLGRLRGTLQNGSEPPYEGASYTVAQLPQGFYSAAWPMLAVGNQNNLPCTAQVDTAGRVTVTPAYTGYQQTEIAFVGVV